MRVEEMLQRYVREVADQLPIKMRSDVSLELATLLREDLQTRAETAGRAPDETLATEVLKSFGPPPEVAARYRPRPAIIDPNETRNFILTVIIGAAILVTAGVPSMILEPGKTHDLGTPILWWIGAVVVYFGLRGWARRRWPRQRDWAPTRKDPDRVSRVGSVALILMIGLGITVFSEPQRAFALLTGGHRLASSLEFDPGFRFGRLPWLLAAWMWQAVLFLVVAVRGRWNPALRRIELVLSMAVCGLLAWFSTDGPVMTQSVPNATAKAFMVMITLFLLIIIGAKIYQQAGQVSDRRLRAALGG
jgi:hypothetical protein